MSKIFVDQELLVEACGGLQAYGGEATATTVAKLRGIVLNGSKDDELLTALRLVYGSVVSFREARDIVYKALSSWTRQRHPLKGR